MHTYTPMTFDLPSLDGISEKQVDVHLGLYKGYVNTINRLQEERDALAAEDPEKHAFALESVRRRLGFEFNGMRMHELYFSEWEGGASDEPCGSTLDMALAAQFGSFNEFLKVFKSVGMSRGSGWSTLACDKKAKALHVYWTADHELGQLADVEILLTMDMWEHAYMVDYVPAEKAKHIEAFFKNLNWQKIEDRFARACAAHKA